MAGRSSHCHHESPLEFGAGRADPSGRSMLASVCPIMLVPGVDLGVDTYLI
jgi:hypothetical protein